MRRELKFRAWDDYSESMIFTDGSCGTDSTDFVWQVEIDSIRCYKIDLITENYSGECNQSFEVNTSDILPVMQYTGLKDAINKNEVYEHDIINLLGIGFLKVEWDYSDTGWRCIDKHYKKRNLVHVLLNGGIRVGNIYENPELLEK